MLKILANFSHWLDIHFDFKYVFSANIFYFQSIERFEKIGFIIFKSKMLAELLFGFYDERVSDLRYFIDEFVKFISNFSLNRFQRDAFLFEDLDKIFYDWKRTIQMLLIALTVRLCTDKGIFLAFGIWTNVNSDAIFNALDNTLGLSLFLQLFVLILKLLCFHWKKFILFLLLWEASDFLGL